MMFLKTPACLTHPFPVSRHWSHACVIEALTLRPNPCVQHSHYDIMVCKFFRPDTRAVFRFKPKKHGASCCVKKEGFRLENEVKERAKRNEKCYGGSVWRLEIPNRKDQGRTLTPSCCSAVWLGTMFLALLSPVDCLGHFSHVTCSKQKFYWY
ncbi:hypothetical protein NC651_029265 [Populus alba x Populus x berolinensis]|nr:hypothetical protein NC651_029265 [Populus alba x Populus x berolinensis]